MKYIYLYLSMLCLVACNEQPTEEKQAIVNFYAPPAGTVIASDSMRIVEDELNEQYYCISISTNENSGEGNYDLEAAFGFNNVQSQLVYPKLDKQITPAIRRDTSMPYSYIVGFRFDGETEFKDYARIAATLVASGKRQIELRYLKAYYMDSTGK